MCVTPEFISTPTAVNTTLGSTVNFNCSVTTGVVVWIFNGSLLSELNAPDITAYQIENTFVLHVPAIEEYNNTVVTCAVAILGGDDKHSDPVLLRVQGRFYICKMLHQEGVKKDVETLY